MGLETENPKLFLEEAKEEFKKTGKLLQKERKKQSFPMKKREMI